MTQTGTRTKTIRIIAVDDDPAILALMRHMLDGNGYRLTRFSNPEEAVEAVLADPPDLVITDLSMPTLNGIDLIKKLRKTYAPDQLPIMVLSALGEEEVILNCFAAGATDFLNKPLHEGALRAKAQLLVSRAREHRALPDDARSTSIFDEEGEWRPERLVGRVFAGYHIEAKIGQGGMGVVSLVHAAEMLAVPRLWMADRDRVDGEIALRIEPKQRR